MSPTTNSFAYSGNRVVPIINPDDAMASQLPVKLKASTTFVAGTVVGEITASPGTYGPYASGHSDGTEIPAGILEYGAVTDASSNITNADEWGLTGLVTPMFTEGDFLVSELTGLDANAIEKLSGKVTGNTAATQIFTF